MVTRERRLDRARATADRAVREVGRQLREARFAAGLSLRELSDAVGISRSELSRIELGKSPQVPVRTLVIVAALLGIDLSVRGFPAGDPIRDAGQLRLIGRFRTALPPALSWRSEVPIDAPGDMRAWDGVITAKGWQAAVEAETRLSDVQACLRRLALKRRDDRRAIVILLLADTRHNRRVARAAGLSPSPDFPIVGWKALAALRAGDHPGGSAVIWA